MGEESVVAESGSGVSSEEIGSGSAGAVLNPYRWVKIEASVPIAAPQPVTQIRLRPIANALVGLIESSYRFERGFLDRHVARFEEVHRAFVAAPRVGRSGREGSGAGDVPRERCLGLQEK